MGGPLRHELVRPAPASTGNRLLCAVLGIEPRNMVLGQQGTHASLVSHARGPRDANGFPIREGHLRIPLLYTQAGVCSAAKNKPCRFASHSPRVLGREFGWPT